MSAVDVVERPRHEAGFGRLLVLWLPPLLLLLAVAGIVWAVPSVNSEQSGRTWYGGVLGGSELYRINVIFARVVPFLAGGFIALALLQRRWLRARERHTATSLQRHGWTEVFTHWLNAAGIMLCLVTAVFLLGWVDNPVSLQTTYILHLTGSGFVVAAVFHHLTYHLVGGGQGLLPRSRRDVKNALAETVSYAGVYRGLPGVFGIQLPVEVRRKIQPLLRRLDLVPEHGGKYLATEKVVSYSGWAILIGVVLVTGLLKALNYIYGMPGWLLQGATFLHDGATIFFIILLVLHVSALVLVPRNWPLLRSMFTTRVPRSYAQRHLPLWVEEEGSDVRPGD